MTARKLPPAPAPQNPGMPLLQRPSPAQLQLRVPAKKPVRTPAPRTDSALSRRPDLLLSVLEDLVASDRHPTKMNGVIGFAIKDGQGQFHCWWVDFSEGRKSFGQGAALPANANAVVVLGQEEAEQILVRGRLPRTVNLLEQAGDLKLLGRFFQRYCRRFDLLGVRGANRTTPATSRRRPRTRI